MINEQEFAVTLTISDPFTFCINPVSSAVQRINHDYIGKCYNQYFLVRLTKIRISDCRISNITSQGIADVHFCAEAIRFLPGDIVFLTVKIEDKLITGEHLHPIYGYRLCARCIHSDIIEVLSHGDKVPVVITLADHKIETNEINISFRLTGYCSALSVELDGEVELLPIKLINLIQPRVDSEQAEFFYNLLASPTDRTDRPTLNSKPPNSGGLLDSIQSGDLAAVNALSGKCVKINRLTSSVYISGKESAVKMKMDMFIKYFLREIFIWNKFTNEASEFITMEDIARQQVLWSFIKNLSGR